MTKKERVVELLRAVAGSTETIYEYATRNHFAYDVAEEAEAAREAVIDAWLDYGGSDDHYNESCLRAAQRIEEGSYP